MTTEPTKPKTKRRWLQFSLRTFFVLLTVFCVWLGWTVHRANEQRKAVEWVREMGGLIDYDYEYDEDGNFLVDAEPYGPKWLVQLLGADYFQEVSGVDLHGTQVSDLTPLAKLTSLQYLYVWDTQVSDLTPLAGLQKLERLYVDATEVSDLTPLARLTTLRKLVLNDTQVSDLTPLATLTGLQELLLDNTQVSEEQANNLREALPNCCIDDLIP